MKILKNILLFLGVAVLGVISSGFVGDSYYRIFNSGTWVDLREIIGLPLSYLFFLSLIFTAFGDKHKYWWIGLLSLPALAFEIYFDLAHIYIPILLSILGWAVGLGITKFIVKKN